MEASFSPGRQLRHWFALLGAGLVAVATATGCVTNEEHGVPDGWQEPNPAPVARVVDLVPEDIRAQGVVSIGTNPPFAPAEFKDSAGTIIGFDIDLARAAAKVMGLELSVQDQDFAMILPAVNAGTVTFGASGFTDNEERRKSFDFVDYLTAGIQWAARTGQPVDPDHACGLTVAVQRATVSDTDDVTAKSEACVAAGQPPITKLAYESSDAAATALILGRADAFSADSPVAAYAVARSEGKIELVGEIFDAAPYGWPVKKDSPLAPALAAALDELIASGEYARILQTWGISEGLVSEARINGTTDGVPPR
ncbi:ABC transporter substrate-binding protein [Corynebacterium choanae]|uniref:ABC transporter glutamine-binding protein GlnH n=1 Tax=Corynebacterium choanae TaxID=1862358 RepID=A0A3G6J419_9CORY|nr:ABC transporter substrate-binding protein [Corynebacterium choanae]AZA12453.1 ABC transporter glutamine-binding protein GlnH precursor [Corynebacterium choanae]